MKTLEHLKTLIQSPNLASKKWIYEQYDSQVMNDTIYTKGDAAIVRVHGTNKALAMSTDCNPRYVQADAFEGAKQAVAETYRNISAVGGKPLAITNCLNFGNPQKPEIMGQIVRAIKGITEACKVLDYPVVSGNVSLYNETNGKAIKPTPAIGGVGLLKDLSKRSSLNFKQVDDVIFVIGKTKGHINCSIFEKEILKIGECKNPPIVDLSSEKKHGEFVRQLIEADVINACHDVSDGGLLVALFEMCDVKKGFSLETKQLQSQSDADINDMLFGEDQSRYVVTLPKANVEKFLNLAKQAQVDIVGLGEVILDKIKIYNSEVTTKELIELNSAVFEKAII